jgi:hypothetical protein
MQDPAEKPKKAAPSTDGAAFISYSPVTVSILHRFFAANRFKFRFVAPTIAP